MSQTIPPSITASPATPDRADRATFSGRATAWADWLKNSAVSQIAAVATNVYDNSVDAWASAGAASASVGDASNYADIAGNLVAQALATANVTEWVSGAYSLGDCVYSPINLHTYRCKTTGARVTDPSLDGANWQILTYSPAKPDPWNYWYSYTATAGDMYAQYTGIGSFVLTLPPSPVIGDPPVLIHDVGFSFNIYPLILDGNGEKLYGNFDQLTIRIKGLIAYAVYFGADTGWKLM